MKSTPFLWHLLGLLTLLVNLVMATPNNPDTLQIDPTFCHRVRCIGYQDSMETCEKQPGYCYQPYDPSKGHCCPSCEKCTIPGPVDPLFCSTVRCKSCQFTGCEQKGYCCKPRDPSEGMWAYCCNECVKC